MLIRPWIQVIRAFAFPASLMPVFVGGALALSYQGQVIWPVYPIVILCSLLLHAGTNVISEYFDFKKGVDQKHTLGSSRILVDAVMAPNQVLAEGYILLGMAFLFGLILVILRGLPMLIIGITGLLGGYFYSAGPIGYKYRGLGDFMVFLLMGPLMVVGAYFALTGTYNYRILCVSLPVGFLVTAILSSNNLRDIANDQAAGVKTFESLIGYSAAKRMYFFLIVSAYLSVVIMILNKLLPVLSLLVFFSLPLALKNIKAIKNNSQANPEQISGVDVVTAKLHLAFGLLLTLSLIIAKFIK